MEEHKHITPEEVEKRTNTLVSLIENDIDTSEVKKTKSLIWLTVAMLFVLIELFLGLKELMNPTSDILCNVGWVISFIACIHWQEEARADRSRAAGSLRTLKVLFRDSDE